MDHLRFNLNGQWIEERGLSPTTTLLRYLRDTRGLTGTKEGCAEGDCGACTVALVERGPDGAPVYRAVNSCLMLLPMIQGKHVITVEALKQGDDYHPAQVAMAKALGSQCGYCTPGVVMSLFEASYRTDLDASWKVDDQLCGNLCRCTGYKPIRAAAEQVAGSCPKDRFLEALPQSAPQSMALAYEAEGRGAFTPTSFSYLWAVLDSHPEARFIAGGTDVSLEITKKFEHPRTLVSLEGLEELRAIRTLPDAVSFGATVTIAELEEATVTSFPPLHRMTRYFGARQIKHRGTIGGNLGSASPIGDLAPVLISLGATAVLQSRLGTRRMPLEDFFIGYRKTALGSGELLAAVEVPTLRPTTRALAYKVSKRRELDITTVSAGLYLETDAANLVTRARFAYGGMAATPKRASQAEAALLGKPWTRENADAAARLITSDFTPLNDHRGSAAYRALVAANLIRGFYEETLESLQPRLAPRHAATVQTTDEARRA